MILIYNNSIKLSDDDLQYNICQANPLYIKENAPEGIYISRFTYEKSYTALRNKLLDSHNEICNNYAFNMIDDNIIESFTNMPLHSLIDLLDNIYHQKENKVLWPIARNTIVNDIEEIMGHLIKSYHFTCAISYSITQEHIDILQYEKNYNISAVSGNIMEYEYKIYSQNKE